MKQLIILLASLLQGFMEETPKAGKIIRNIMAILVTIAGVLFGISELEWIVIPKQISDVCTIIMGIGSAIGLVAQGTVKK
jgi:hypothetical protein